MNGPLQDFASRVMPWIWECSWQASLLVFIVLLVQTVFGRRLAPGWRYGLWTLVAIRLLLPALPESRTSMYGLVAPAGEFAQNRFRTALGFQGDAEIASMAQVTPVKAPHAAASQPIIRRTWRQWLTLGWLTGTVWMLVRLAVATTRFRTAVRRSRRVPTQKIQELLNEAAGLFHMRAPEAVETTAVGSPAVTGLLRPLVVLPLGLEKRFSNEEIRFLLLHELAHIRRGDLWANFTAEVLHSFHWFNPVLWIAIRRSQHDREAACDARVLRTQHPDDRNAYGHTLIKVLEGLQSPRHSAAVVGILESPGQLRQRLLRITGYTKPTKIAVLGGLFLILGLAATMLTRAAFKPDQPKPTPSIAAKDATPIKTDTKLSHAKRPLLSEIYHEGWLEEVEAALKSGAKLDQDILQAALIRATQSDNDEAAEVFLKYGARANELAVWSEQGDKMFPLLMCAIHGKTRTAKVLIAHGADPNAGDLPMLNVAINNGYPEMAKILRQAGAKGCSDLCYAIAIGDKNQIDALLSSPPTYHDNPAFWESVMPTAALRGNLSIVRTAVEKGVPVTSDKDEGNADARIRKASLTSGYYAAAHEGQHEVLEFLLNQRAVKSAAHDLSPALWVAVWNSHPYPGQRPAKDFEKCIRLLLDADAPVHSLEEPLYNLIAAAVFTRNPGGNPRVIEMLCSAGVDPNPGIEKGKHLLDYAVETRKEKNHNSLSDEVVSTLEKCIRAGNTQGRP